MTALVSHYEDCYPQVCLGLKGSEPFDSGMEGIVFKSFSSLYILPYTWTTSLSCSDLEMVKGSVLWSFAVQSAEQ